MSEIPSLQPKSGPSPSGVEGWARRRPMLAALLLVGVLALLTLGGLLIVVPILMPTPPPPVELPKPPPPEHLLSISAHPHEVLSLALSPDDQRIASADWQGAVYLWNAATGKVHEVLQGHRRQVLALAFRPDCQRLATGSADLTVRIWDTATGQEVHNLGEQGKGVICLAFSPDGKRLVSGGVDGTVQLWDADSGKRLRSLKGHDAPVVAVAFSPDWAAGKQVLSAGAGGSVRAWHVEGKLAFSSRGRKGGVEAAVFSPDGNWLALAAGSLDWAKGVHLSAVKVHELVDGEEGQELALFEGPQGPITCLAFSPDGERLASACQDRVVRISDATTGRKLLALPAGAVITCLAWSADGKRLVTGSKGPGPMGEVKVWDVTTDPLMGSAGH